MVLDPRCSPWHTPAAIAITFLSAAPISTPTGSLLVYSRNVGPENATCSSRASSASADEIAAVAGSPRAISLANVGPERTATRGVNLRPTTSPITSVILINVPFSSPFVALTKHIEGRRNGSIFP